MKRVTLGEERNTPFDYLSITKWKQQTPEPCPPLSDNHSFPHPPGLSIFQYQLCKGSHKPAGSRQKVPAPGRYRASSCFQPYASIDTTRLSLVHVLADKLRKTKSLYSSQQMKFLQLFAVSVLPDSPFNVPMLAPPLFFVLLVRDSY